MKRLLVLTISLVMVLTMAACESGDKDNKSKFPEYKIDPQAITLTVEGQNGEKKVFTEEELKKLGTETHSYSGRNKSVENARQFFTYEGVDLKKVLKAAGLKPEGAGIKVLCADGYTREYQVDELYDLYYFPNNETDDKEKVTPMIALVPADGSEKYPSPFKMVHGQEDYDTATTMDFNMQGWASYMQYIQVAYD